MAAFQLGLDIRALFPYFGHQCVVQPFYDGDGPGSADWIAAEGRTVGVVRQRILAGIGEHRRRKGQAAADGLGRRDDIGMNAVIHVGVQRTCTAVAGLHFVDDDQNILFMGIVDDGVDKGRVEGMNAAFALYQFHHDSADIILFSQSLDRFKVICFGVDEAVQEGTEILMKRILAAGRQRGHRPAVKAVFQRDDRIAAVAVLVVRIFAGRLDGAFVRFCAGVGKEDLFHARFFAEHFCQDDLGLCIKYVGNMAQLVELGRHRILPDIVTDAEDVDGNAGAEVDILLAVDIVQDGTLAVVQHGIHPVVYVYDIFFICSFKIHSQFVHLLFHAISIQRPSEYLLINIVPRPSSVSSSIRIAWGTMPLTINTFLTPA